MENESKSGSSDELYDEYDYAISTSTIFDNEYKFKQDPEGFNWRKFPDEYAHDLVHTIQELLVKHVKPTVDYSDDHREYLKNKFERFNKAHFTIEPFHINYFVTAYDQPRNENGDNPLRFVGDNYYYFYSYDERFIVSRKNVTNQQFELLFAFALRQCDLMHIQYFLSFHLLSNFESKTKQYCQYLKQINRKFSSLIFTKELSDSIYDWITENENKANTLDSGKIKTFLTVDQLAFLFRALVDNGHLSDDNKNTIISWACKNFESKMKQEISEKSFNQKFYAPSNEALAFWKEQFDKLLKLTIRMEQKKGD